MYHDVASGEVTRYDFNVIENHLKQVETLIGADEYHQFMREEQQREIEFDKFKAFLEQFQLLKGFLPQSNRIEGKPCAQRTGIMCIMFLVLFTHRDAGY